MRTLLKTVLVVFAAFCCLVIFCFIILPKTPVFYKSPAVSATIIDTYTGRPIEGATVQVRWGALRPRFLEGSDTMDIHTAAAVTDSNGDFTIPAWGPIGVAREWRYYDYEPMVSFSKPGYQSSYRDNHNNQDYVTADAIPFLPVTLSLPSWEGNSLELERLQDDKDAGKVTGALSYISDQSLSNSLSYYVINGQMVEGGRYINSLDFPKIGYIRPKPDVVITRIQSFSTNVARDYLYDNWHVIGLPADQQWLSGFSITLSQTDAKKITDLERHNIAHANLLFMLGDQPLAETYMAKDAGYSDSILVPTGPQTIYLPLRNHQDIWEINEALERLVQP